MASTNKTPTLGLSQFEGSDKASWLGDYNADMAAIDEKTLDKTTYDPDSVGTNVYEADNHKMTGYSKPTQATPVAPTDSTLTAIGKVEKSLDGKGDMSKSVYDTTNSGKVDTAKIADEAKKIDWTGVDNRPISLPNPKALTMQQNGSTTATYDGDTARTFNVTPDSIGAAKLEAGKVPDIQLPIDDTTTSTSAREVGSANSVRLAKEEAITASGEQSDAKIVVAIEAAAPNILYTNAGLPEVASVKQGLDDMALNKAAIGDPDLLAHLSTPGATNLDSGIFPIPPNGTMNLEIKGATTAGQFEYSQQSGVWARQGKDIKMHFTIILSKVITAPVGQLIVTGLPFSSSLKMFGDCLLANYNALPADVLGMKLQAMGNQLYVMTDTSVSYGSFNSALVKDNFIIQGSISFMTN